MRRRLECDFGGGKICPTVNIGPLFEAFTPAFADTDSEVFEIDRWRQNLLVLDGWCVLRFSSSMIDERPAEVIAMVREALQMLGAALLPQKLTPMQRRIAAARSGFGGGCGLG